MNAWHHSLYIVTFDWQVAQIQFRKDRQLKGEKRQMKEVGKKPLGEKSEIRKVLEEFDFCPLVISERSITKPYDEKMRNIETLTFES